MLGYYLRSRVLGIKKPILAGLKLTHNCNLKCEHCPFWQNRDKSLSFLGAKQCMNELYEQGVRILIIEGGEPFLWKDGEYSLKDIVTEAKKLFFSVGVTTNGTFPIDVEADIIWVSIDGLEETHNQIRGESFDQIIANVSTSTHLKIYAHITINSLNYEEIPSIVEFIANKVKGITIQFHYPYNGGTDKLFLEWDKREKVLDNLIQLKRKGLPIANSEACLKALKKNSWTCHPFMIASVEPDGKITQGCYVKNRGIVSCVNCGFSAHTEISLAYATVIGAMKVGTQTFLSHKPKSNGGLQTSILKEKAKV
ncbi:MAG: radical SAM protein [Candidatus Stahlbacteria bacterium]|nr:radical SAM protein [Candidatus Stahlbacteria bacterium]